MLASHTGSSGSWLFWFYRCWQTKFCCWSLSRKRLGIHYWSLSIRRIPFADWCLCCALLFPMQSPIGLVIKLIQRKQLREWLPVGKSSAVFSIYSSLSRYDALTCMCEETFDGALSAWQPVIPINTAYELIVPMAFLATSRLSTTLFLFALGMSSCISVELI